MLTRRRTIQFAPAFAAGSSVENASVVRPGNSGEASACSIMIRTGPALSMSWKRSSSVFCFSFGAHNPLSFTGVAETDIHWRAISQKVPLGLPVRNESGKG